MYTHAIRWPTSAYSRLRLHLITYGWLLGWFDPRHHGCMYACAIPWPASTYSRLRLHLTCLMSMNLITERADMPCIVACMFQSLILCEAVWILSPRKRGHPQAAKPMHHHDWLSITTSPPGPSLWAHTPLRTDWDCSRQKTLICSRQKTLEWHYLYANPHKCMMIIQWASHLTTTRQPRFELGGSC
jgi:hypothetical protein